MRTSKSYEVDYQLAADTMAQAIIKLLGCSSGQQFKTSRRELKQIVTDYVEARRTAQEMERSPWGMSLSDPDLRFQRKG